MEGIHQHFTVRTCFSFLLLILLQTSADAQNICFAPRRVDFPENNTVGAVISTITVEPGVTLGLTTNPDNTFSLEGNDLIAVKVLDHEGEVNNYFVEITCTETATSETLGLPIVVIVTNVNDNPPVFDLNPYLLHVTEMSPVNMSVGHFAASDLDPQTTLYYTLTPESAGFILRSDTNPDLLIETSPDYDKVKSVELTLTARDTEFAAGGMVSFTATTTILITISDVDNRPPWFQPCNKHEIGGVVICQSNGYTGKVVLNEREPGVLPLKPGPLYALDGDVGINEAMMYSILSGNDDGLFEINPNTGNISMLKPADVLGTISLTVLAAQQINTFQFSTTTVTVSVQVKSLHPPQFQKLQYEGVITGVGVMATDPTNKDEPLLILATDEDYAATGGRNPHITYSVKGSSDFSIIDGFLFMTRDLPEGTLSLQVVATDESNDENVTAQLSVEMKSGPSTTSLPQSTTDITATASTGESTSNSHTTEEIMSTTNPSTSTNSSLPATIPSTTSESIISTTSPSLTSEGSISTTDSSLTSEGSISTTNPSLTSEGSVSTASSTHPHTVIVPSGGFGPEDMAALGATLGVLLFICLVVIVVLAVRLQRGKAAWRKIYEASMFQSSLGRGVAGQKGGIQYTNDAFEKDEDGGSTGSGGPAAGSVTAGGKFEEFPLSDAVTKSSLHALLPDDAGQTGSDKTDNKKKGVIPILTKERRVDEGYKSVWFKEDIDPNAKEEVVIIPDSREDDSEEEDEERSSSGGEEDEDDNARVKTPKVVFNDADLDSGLGVKMDPAEDDEEGDEVLTVDL